MTRHSNLVWSPTHEYLSARIHQETTLRILIAPFIKLDALAHLLSTCQDTTDLQVIVRWRPQDLVSDVSDLAIYPFLRERRISLYVHPDVHLKLFVFNDAMAFHTSGNITRKGIGLTPDHNIEIGCEVSLATADWEQIFLILNASERVDDEVYARALTYIEANKTKPPPLPPLDLRPLGDKRFSRLSLPSSPNPESLHDYYRSVANNAEPQEDASAFIHDLNLYCVPPGLTREQFFSVLGRQFRTHPFITAIAGLIKQHGSARFGLVNDWITKNCSDRPTPYRWEMKSATRRLYDWLDSFFPEISWDVPGSHSMVIRWN